MSDQRKSILPPEIDFVFACENTVVREATSIGYIEYIRTGYDVGYPHFFCHVRWNGLVNSADPESDSVQKKIDEAYRTRCRCGGRATRVYVQVEPYITANPLPLHSAQADENDLAARLEASVAALRVAAAEMRRDEAAGDASPASALLDDAASAAWRTAATQFVRLAREPICALLARHGLDARPMLQTEVGVALLGGALSLLVRQLPIEQGARLATELRRAAMGKTADAAIDLLAGPLREALATALRGGAPAQLEAPAVSLGALAHCALAQQEKVAT